MILQINSSDDKFFTFSVDTTKKFLYCQTIQASDAHTWFGKATGNQVNFEHMKKSIHPAQCAAIQSKNASEKTVVCIAKITAARMDATRPWVKTETGGAQERKPFLDDAVNNHVKKIMSENPDFKLPPACSF